MSNEPDMHLNYVWNTLMFFAHPDSYTQGERTGGVLQGCPRAEPPSPDTMAGYARNALAELRRHIGIDPDAWMLDGSHAPQQRLQLTDAEATALHRSDVVSDALLAYHLRPCDTEAAAVVRAVAAQFTELVAPVSGLALPATTGEQQ